MLFDIVSVMLVALTALMVLGRKRRRGNRFTIFAGMDKTSGDSGACGVNRALVVTMPFPLEKVS